MLTSKRQAILIFVAAALSVVGFILQSLGGRTSYLTLGFSPLMAVPGVILWRRGD